MVRNRIYYACALAGAVAFYIAYQQWLSWLLLMGLLGLPWLSLLVSLLVSLPMLLSFRGELRLPGTINLGDRATAALTGRAKYLVLPFSGRLDLCRCITGETWRYANSGPVPAEHCGCILVQPEKVFVYDALGLFRFRVRNLEAGRITVRPRPVSMGKLPELERFLARSWRPKPGGGYSELHEMRLYRPGDSLNQIHWKLTAKTGKLTIREPQEPNLGLVLLTLDICGTGEVLDRKFGQLLWLGSYLLERKIPFEIRAMTGDGVFCAPVSGKTDLEQALDALLGAGPAARDSVLDRDYPAAWRCHIGGESGED